MRIALATVRHLRRLPDGDGLSDDEDGRLERQRRADLRFAIESAITVIYARPFQSPAIHEVANGRAIIDPAVTQSVIDQLGLRLARSELTARFDDLTPREREVLVLVARGFSNAEVAAELVISEGTTKTRVAHVLSKIRVRDRAQAIVLATTPASSGRTG
jgi:DNA-binding NarL/FixJ family response regulator